MSDTILVSPHQNHFPVLKRLAKAIPNVGFISLHPQFTKSLQDLDLAAKSLMDVADNELGATAHSAAAHIEYVVQSAKLEARGLHPAPFAFVKQGLPGFLYSRIPDLAATVLALDRAQPRLVLLHNDVEPMTRVVALWARARGVPCLHIPHAVYMGHDGRGPVGTDVHDLVTASHIAVAGPFQKAWYAARGQPEDRMRETGLPQYDKWAKLGIAKADALRLLGLEKGKPIIVYASSWRQNTNLMGQHNGVESCYIAFLAATKEWPGAQIVVKTHPNAHNDEWHAQQAKAMEVSSIVTGLHLEIVLAAADALVAYGPSNSLVEAANFPGIRLLAIGRGFHNDAAVTTIPELSEGPALADAISSAVKAVLAVPAPDTLAFRLKYMGLPDGGAGERVAKYAEELYGMARSG